MAEAANQQLSSGDKLLPPGNVETQAALTIVRGLDPELFNNPATQQLVELGVQFSVEVAEQYGTPTHPKQVSGTYETGVFMTCHNGGPDGHTGVGPRGAGIPRNVLEIAQAVNTAADREVYDPLMRATVFYAAGAHDIHMLNGRSLMPEGQGEGHGDERLSAEAARNRYVAAGGGSATALQAYAAVMATAFNPETGSQNVSYEAWRQNSVDPVLSRTVLVQELLAAADLFGPTGPHGPLGAIEYSVETLCLIAPKDRLIQKQLQAAGVDPSSIGSMEQLLGFIGTNRVLCEAFASAIDAQSKFFSGYLSYSDEAIRAACGRGIDELFPGRPQNALVLSEYGKALHAGTEPLAIWQQARELAGY